MKKIICLISALTLFTAVFSGCGNDKPNKKTPILDDGEGNFVIAKTEPAATLPKIKQNNTDSDETTATNSSDETSDENKNVSGGEDVSDDNGSEVSEVSGDSSNNVTGSSTTSSSSQTATSAAQTSTTPMELYYLEGRVYSVSGGSVTLKDPDIGWVQASFDGKSALKDVMVGDKVLITHDGEIAAAAPAVTKKTYGIEVTEKAPEECTLKQFECKNLDYNLSFSILVPNSWSSINIDYPTEGDFTDWGVRFTPKGETKGLDISWHSSFAILEPYDVTPITVNGIEVSRYSKKGKWRFYDYNNDYIAANTFYNTSSYDEFTDDMEFMLETLEFGDISFLN